MTMPKKNSRLINVDGKSYRWLVKTRHDLLILTIQENKKEPGKVYQSKTDKEFCGTITPSYVSETIRQAIKAGWNPSK